MSQQIHLLRIREFRVLNSFEALCGSPDPPLAFPVSSRVVAIFGRFSTIDPAIRSLVVRIEGGVPKHETCVTPWPLQMPAQRPRSAKRAVMARANPSDAEKRDCQPHHFIREPSFQPNCRMSEIVDHSHTQGKTGSSHLSAGRLLIFAQPPRPEPPTFGPGRARAHASANLHPPLAYTVWTKPGQSPTIRPGSPPQPPDSCFARPFIFGRRTGVCVHVRIPTCSKDWQTIRAEGGMRVLCIYP